MRKFKKGDKIYRAENPELIVQVDDIQEIHQHYVCTNCKGEHIFIPFFCEEQWNFVSQTESEHKFKVGDIIVPISLDKTEIYHIVGVDEKSEHYLLKESDEFGLPFNEESKWELAGVFSMNETENKTLCMRYETLANDYLSEFVKQTCIEDDAPFWVGGEVAGIACVADYFVDYKTIRYVVDGKMTFEDFDEWYCYCNEVKMIDDSLFTPTLEQWCYGEFTRISDERLEEMKKLKKDFEQMVQEEKEKQAKS